MRRPFADRRAGYLCPRYLLHRLLVPHQDLDPPLLQGNLPRQTLRLVHICHRRLRNRLGSGRARRYHLQLLPCQRLLGSHDETCTFLHQLQSLLHCQLGYEHLRRCDDSVPANGKDMEPAHVAQVQGCGFGHVPDGRVVCDS